MFVRIDEVDARGTPQSLEKMLALSVHVFFVLCVSGNTCG